MVGCESGEKKHYQKITMIRPVGSSGRSLVRSLASSYHTVTSPISKQKNTTYEMTNISASNGSSNKSSSFIDDLPSEAEGIAWCSAFALEAVLIAAGNLPTIVLFTVYKEPRKKSLLLVINMAFADLIFGAVHLPFYIYLSVGEYFRLWTASLPAWWYTVVMIIQTVSLQASSISATFISCERFYAIYWPLKHRTLSIRAYRIVIFMVWALATVVFVIFFMLSFFISSKHVVYAWIPYTLTMVFIICGCNIGIWRKFQHGSIPSQQRNRALQNQRLTMTLLFVSAVALLSWLSIIVCNVLKHVFEVFIPLNIFCLAVLLCYSNSFLNPVVYALRIPEFRQALGLCCSRRQAGTRKSMEKVTAGCHFNASD